MACSHTDDNKLQGHKKAEKVKDDFEDRPTWRPPEAPCAGGQHKAIPGGDGEGADEEVFVGAEMGRKLEGGRETHDGHKATGTDVCISIPDPYAAQLRSVPATNEQPSALILETNHSMYMVGIHLSHLAVRIRLKITGN